MLLFLIFGKIFTLMRKNLDTNVVPQHYDLYMDVSETEFQGRVKIDIKALEPTRTFQINSKSLDIKSIKINGEEIDGFDEKEEFVTIKHKREIQGESQLEISYKGVFGENVMEGFYKSMQSGEPIYSTHFEPTEARSAFPCFDQPDMKATFSISLKVPKGNIALSNNELESQDGDTFTFKKTPLMSTYIVAFVIGKMESLEYRSEDEVKRSKKSRIPIRVYASKDEVQWGQFALEVATRCLDFFEKYFEIDYPLPKLDLVAISSFAMGAMENWGLITFRSTSLLYDEKTTSLRSKKNIAITVCHELAHMWFGNLVTMKWWDDLWLNEGFATWAATLAAQESLQDILPWNAWMSFVNDETESGMSMDSLRSTHRIGIEVEDPVDIDQIFDAISYSKGASIIRMVEGWLGAENFRKGLVKYLNTHKYSNSVTKDLWDAMDAYKDNSSAPVSKAIHNWIYEEGFPYIQVEESDDSLHLRQEHFILGPSNPASTVWSIPIKIYWIESNESETIVMTEKEMKIKRKSASYKLNDNFSGFYRVLYPKKTLQNLLSAELSVLNIMSVYSDAFSFSKKLVSPIPSVTTIEGQDNYDVVLSVLGDLGFYQSVFYFDEKISEIFRSESLKLVKHHAEKINYLLEDKSVNKVSLDSLIVSRGVTLDYEPIVAHLKGMKEVPGEFLRQYYMVIVDEHFDKVFEIYLNGETPSQRTHALFALGTTRVKSQIDVIFEKFKSIKPHDTVYLFAALSSNLKMRNYVMNLYIKHFKSIKEHINNIELLRRSIENVFMNVIDPEEKSKALDFLNGFKDMKEMKSAYDKTIDSIIFKTEVYRHYSEKNSLLLEPDN